MGDNYFLNLAFIDCDVLHLFKEINQENEHCGQRIIVT